MNILTTLSPWHWWALAVLLLALELVAPTSFFLWPAVAAAIIGIVLWFAPHIGVLAQILTFIFLAAGAITIWRAGPWHKRRHAGDAPLLNERAAQYIGRRATVVEAFRNGRGEVEIDDTRWRAEAADGSDIAQGAHVVIKAVEGILLKVASAQ
jgi:inner membrane protein